MGRISDKDVMDMLLIRKFEMALLDLFSRGLIGGTAHTCLGQEYIPVSLRPLIRSEDFVISNHRGHGHFIAMTGNMEGLLAEIAGREGAVCGGVGGSQHLLCRNVMTTGVQGEGTAVGLGIAWSFLQEGKGSTAFVFVGDGTFGRGAVYESLNMAALYRLPYVLVVENNGIAMSTRISEGMSGTIEGRAKGFGIKYMGIDAWNPDAIREMVGPAVEEVRRGSGPLVVEFKTCRVGPHSKGDDSRTKEEIRRAEQQYWYNILKAEEPERMSRLDADADKKIMQIVQDVMARGEACGS